MVLRKGIGLAAVFVLLSSVLLSCVPPPVVKPVMPPVPEGAAPEGLQGARWGMTVEETKKATLEGGNPWFLDSTDRAPFTLYASGTYLNASALFTYFFTPKTKKLYRVDVTFQGLGIYEKARVDLTGRFKTPTFSAAGTDHWDWDDKSVVILQKNADTIQVGYSGGAMLVLNQQEGNGLLIK
jgi:hypothetical protein